MSFIYTGNPMIGSAAADYIFGVIGIVPDNTTINGNDGNDFILGDYANYVHLIGPGSLATSINSAFNIDTAVSWNTGAISTYAQGTGSPHTAVYLETQPGWSQVFLAVTVGVGQTIQLDVDFSRNTDSVVAVLNASGTILAQNDDAAGDAGSFTSLDSFLTYTPGAAGVYYISIRELDSTYEGDETLILNVGVTGHAATGTAQPSGNDVINGGAGDDIIYGEGGNDSLLGGDGNDQIFGGDGNDFIRGDAGTNSLNGDAGDDTFFGGTGADNFNGGDGNDTVSYLTSVAVGGDVIDLASSGGFGDSANDTYVSIENVSASDYADRVFGTNVANILLGNNGNDELFGLGGEDRLEGGEGNDFLRGGAGIDILSGGNGDDIIDAQTDDGISADLVHGDGGNDTITGNGWGDYYGDEGDDTFIVGGGARVFDGGNGVDTLNASALAGDRLVNLTTGESSYADFLFNVENVTTGSGNDTITGTSGNNIINGGAGNDIIAGAGGVDLVHGNDGNDTITSGGDGNYYGDAGDDTIFAGITVISGEFLDGGDGVDTLDTTSFGLDYVVNLTTGVTGYAESFINFENLTSGAGNDTLTGTVGVNIINGGAGNDIIYGGAGGADIIHGNDGNDTLTSNGANNSLFGDAGNDLIYAGLGPETLDGGADVDTLDTTSFGGDYDVNLTTGITNYGEIVTNFENLISGAGNDTLTGTSGDNIIKGGAGNDIINALNGNDTLYGGLGADTLNGGDGNDLASYEGSTGPVTISLQNGTASGGDAAGDILTGIENIFGTIYGDLLIGDINNNQLYGAEGDDLLDGREGGDVLYGGAGDDIFIGFQGADLMDGGEGRDLINYILSASAVTINLATNTASGGDAAGDIISGIEDISASNFNDVLVGSDLANSFSGRDGADTISGGAGNDTLNGGAGSDTLNGDAGTDTASYASNSGAIFADLGGNYVGEYAVTTGTVTGAETRLSLDALSSIENVIGSAFGDRVYGDALANQIEGGAGDDVIYGEGGDDRILGGTGADVLLGGVGTDTVDYTGAQGAIYLDINAGFALETALQVGTVLASTTIVTTDLMAQFESAVGSAFGDRIYGNALANRIEGLAGDDIIYGEGGDDTVIGGAGSDILLGGNGTDTLDYSATAGGVYAELFGGFTIETSLQTGTVNAGTAANSTDLHAQFENLIGSAFGDRLYGTAGVNQLSGNAGDDFIFGGAGNDIISGGDGADRLIGEGGADTLTGDAGADRFYFSTAPGAGEADTITDFQTTIDDLYINRAAFGLGAADPLTLVINGPAVAPKSFLYDSATGFLSYDADGAGGAAALVIAHIGAGQALTTGDIVLYG